MIGAGTIISPIIKIVSTVAILAAAYFLIVRPVLDTTEDVTKSATDSFNQGIEQGNQAAAEADAEASAAEINSARQSATSYANSLLAGSQPWPEASKAVLNCVKSAGDDVVKLAKCENLGRSITSGTLSARNFAVSYADSLESQGKTAEAQQVRSCVAKADYEAKAMNKCRSLANKLLFG